MKNQGKNPLTEDLEHILEYTRDIIEEFRDSRIFITGGTGFFGTWLLESFAWANLRIDLKAKLTILTRDHARFQLKAPHLANHKAFDFISGDIRNFSFPAGSFTHLFHLATETNDLLNHTDPLETFDVITVGMRHVLDFAVSSGIKKMLFTSSGAIYGTQPPEITHLQEEYTGAPDCLDPVSAYAEGKRVGELLCKLYSRDHDLAIKIARCFVFVGPYLPLDARFAIGNFILDGLQGNPISVKGDGTPLRSYLYASDLVIWLLTIISKGMNCRPYNVGSEIKVSISELAETVAGCFDQKPPVKIATLADHTPAIHAYIPSVKRIREELGLNQTVGLHEAIKKTINFYLDSDQ